ncbi:hypothetical protein RRF57_009626 [Xylaria bambusicola]|uniref:Uncharacterized protein n=1 Tax=Xylaria bambusicola TaxID=326684 RepID=A0AAN7UR77_9PEZI
MTLNFPGFKLNVMPINSNSRSGNITSQPRPMGYAISWITYVVMLMEGFRNEKSMLMAEPAVHKTIPMTHARIVLAGKSTS